MYIKVEIDLQLTVKSLRTWCIGVVKCHGLGSWVNFFFLLLFYSAAAESLCKRFDKWTCFSVICMISSRNIKKMSGSLPMTNRKRKTIYHKTRTQERSYIYWVFKLCCCCCCCHFLVFFCRSICRSACCSIYRSSCRSACRNVCCKKIVVRF